MSRARYVPLFESIVHSERLADLADDASRTFYLLLLTQWDAWGRCTGRARVLNATVWPLLGKSVQDTERAIADLARVGLIEIHESEDGPFLVMPDWESKAGKIGKVDHRPQSEFPEPKSETLRASPGQSGPTRAKSGQTGPSLARVRGRARSGAQSPSRVSLESGSSREGEPEREGDPLEATVDAPEFAGIATDALREAWAAWLAYRRGIGKRYKSEASASECLRGAVKHGAEAWIAASKDSIANGYQGMWPEKFVGGSSTPGRAPRSTLNPQTSALYDSISNLAAHTAQERA